MIFVTKFFSNIDDLTPSVNEFDSIVHYIDIPEVWPMITLYSAKAIATPTELAMQIWMAFAITISAFILIKFKLVIQYIHFAIELSAFEWLVWPYG